MTFRLPKTAATDAKSVCIVGDFNNWNIHADLMKRLKNGDYAIKLDLEPEKSISIAISLTSQSGRMTGRPTNM